MKRYVIRRLLMAIPLLLAISFVCFVFINIIPSNPAEVALRVQQMPVITEEAIAEMEEMLGLNKPFLVRYFDWVLGCLRGDFGISYVNPARTVAGELARCLPATLQLAAASFVIVLVLICLYRAESSYQLRLSKLTMKGVYLKQIFQVGVPAGIQSTVINFSNVLLQSSVNSFGSIAMAGYTAANNLLGFLYASVNSITQACMSFTSQNYGVGKWKRMDRVLIDCMILTTGVALVIGGAFYGFGPEILKIYTDNEEVVRSGMEILSFTTLTYFLCGLMDLFPGALRGMGHSAVPMILSVLGTVGTRVVWIFLIFPQHRSLDILFISYPVSWLLTILMQVICFGFVRKKVHEGLQSKGAAA